MKRRINDVLEQIKDAAQRVGRRADEVKLVAVTKRFPPEVVEQAAHHGLKVFGENYVQEAAAKIDALLAKGYDLEWHFIGHLQKNKVKAAVKYFDWIETVDSIALLKRIVRCAHEQKKEINILIQVNISEDPGKSGLMPGDCTRFFEDLMALDLGPVRVLGLMTITRFVEDPEQARLWFRMLRELRDQVEEWIGRGISLPHLSMGMSNDYGVAIEEGATIVRVGQALFGPRPDTR